MMMRSLEMPPPLPFLATAGEGEEERAHVSLSRCSEGGSGRGFFVQQASLIA